MSRSFKDAKKNRMGFEALAGKMEKSEKTNYSDDNPHSWYPALDKAKNGYAVIRFLPEKTTDMPWVKTFSHGFDVNGKWYIEECPTTIDGECPVCKSNTEYWNSGVESDKKIASARKRRQSWYANVLIVEDPSNPENEGEIKIFKFGYKIFMKIKDKLTPPEAFADEKPINVFDFWDGADFKLKVRKVDNQVNYDSSSFNDPSPIAGTDKAIEAIWDGMHDISEFTAADKYKPYEDLEKRFNLVTGNTTPAKSAEAIVEQETHDESTTEATTEKTVAQTVEASADEDDTMAFFEDLAEK